MKNDLTPTPLTRIEPDYRTLPNIDAATLSLPAEITKREQSLSETQVLQYVAGQVLPAKLIAQEEALPRVVLVASGRCVMSPPQEDLQSTLRQAFAAEHLNRSTAEALTTFYQLAEVIGRIELLRLGLQEQDHARQLAAEAKAKGAIVDLAELERQRAGALALLGQAELGEKLLDIDLRRRLGLPFTAEEQLRPTGEFGVPQELPNMEAAVAHALAHRPDLVGLRALYLQLRIEHLPTVREFLRTQPNTAGLLGMGPKLPMVRQTMLRRADMMANAVALASQLELEVRKQQLWLLIAERERGAADEVRAAATMMTEQTRQVALARWRAEKQIAHAEEVKKNKGPILSLTATLDGLRARGEVISAVMNWHQARVRFLAAQGMYADGVR